MRIIVRDNSADCLSLDAVDLCDRAAFDKWVRRVQQVADVIWPPTGCDPNNETLQSEQE